MLTRTRRLPRQRGFVLVLVLVAVAMAMVLALGFAAAQSTSVQLARNVDGQAHSRLIAESALEMAIRYVDTSATWRADRPNGLWLADEALDGGSFSLYGEDGEDTDGDGVVDGDGDLNDSILDVLTLKAVATYNGARYTARVVVQPTKRLVMIVNNPSSLSSEDIARRSLLAGWGWTVVLLDTDASESEFDAAVVGSKVIYFPAHTSVRNDVPDYLKATALGLVMENWELPKDIDISGQDGFDYNGTSIDIVDIDHYIIEPFSEGTLQVLTATDRLACLDESFGSGIQVLAAHISDDGDPALSVIAAGGSDKDGNPVPGRRIILPWGGSSFSIHSLNANG